MIVAAVGGGIGLLLADAGVRALPALSGANLPQAERIHIDAYVMGYVTATAALAGILAGLPPAFRLAGGDLLRWMKEGTAQGGSGATGHRVRVALTVSQSRSPRSCSLAPDFSPGASGVSHPSIRGFRLMAF